MRIAEYKQIDTKTVTETIKVDDVVDGEVVGFHEETVTKEIPVMGMVYRDATPEEEAEAAQMAAEIEAEEANREPTAEERIKQLEEQNAVLLECVLEMSEIVYA